MSDAPAQQPARRRRDAAQSRRSILEAALAEFAEHGHAGARIDRIAKASGVSKPMIYSYFDDKDGLYAAALREAYIQIRKGESELHLGDKEPEQAVRALVRFTLEHYRTRPWFISMLNTENLRGGETVRGIEDVGAIQSPMLEQLQAILSRGAAAGVFRDDVAARDLYITIAAICYFPISNAHTLRAVFDAPIDTAWLEAHGTRAEEMVLSYLRPDGVPKA